MTPDDVRGPFNLPPSVTAEDARWLTHCVYEEARGELADGKAAVAKVVLNRTRREPPYFSDGTIKGTVLYPSQFSWTCFDFVAGRYVRVANTPEQVLARSLRLQAKAIADGLVWDACEDAALDVLAETYVGGVGYQALGDDALLYVNLSVSRPAWAAPSKLICRIGAHSFYRA